MAHSKSNQSLIVPLHEHIAKKKGVQISVAATMITFSLIFFHKTICLINMTGFLCQSAFLKKIKKKYTKKNYVVYYTVCYVFSNVSPFSK